jgi:hypothetical protein
MAQCPRCTTPIGPKPQINEVMASNSRTLADDDGYFEDWIEIHNPGPRSIDLGGWGLSDNATRPFKWVFPRGAAVPASGYLLVWASRQDRSDPGRPLHTNFALDRDGEAVVLTSPLGSEVDRSDAVAMPRNVSYGRPSDSGAARAYFPVPTPGRPNVDYTGYLPDAKVAFSPASTTFVDRIEVKLDGAGDGETIHYTMDDSEPTPSSPTYNGPLEIAATTTLKARVFNARGEGGRTDTQRYLEISAALAGRRSNLPIVVIDSLGQSWSKTVTSRGKRRYPGYIFVHEVDAGGASALGRRPDLASPQGGRYRGSSTLPWPKKPYSIQLRNAQNRGTARRFLDMPAHTNWVFYPGYIEDHTFMRNALAFELTRAAGRYAPRTRFVEVFTLRDDTALDRQHYAGVYDVMESLDFGGERIPGRSVDASDTPPPGEIDVHADGPWTGAYLVKRDRLSRDEFAWSTEFLRMTSDAEVGIALEKPKLRNLDGGPYLDLESAAEHSGQARYIMAWMQAFEEALKQDHDNGFATHGYRDFIDFDSWIDYLLINIFTQNRDSLGLSAFYVKHRDGPLEAGPVWDFDRSMGSGSVRGEFWDSWNLDDNRGPLFRRHWWGKLSVDPDFRQALYDRWAALRESVFAAERLVARIQRMADTLDAVDSPYGSAVHRNNDRWPSRPNQQGGFRDEVKRLQAWLVNRANWMDRRDLAGGLLPSPPEMTVEHTGGNRQIRLTPQPGLDVYYTMDGSDPRGAGGAPAGILYEGAFEMPAGTIVIARAATPDRRWSTPARMAVDAYSGN